MSSTSGLTAPERSEAEAREDLFLPAQWYSTTKAAGPRGEIGISFKTADGIIHRFRVEAEEARAIGESITHALAGESTVGMKDQC